VKEPISPEPMVRHLQDRDFYTYRNMGFVLLHVNPLFPAYPVVFESFEQLQAYHQESFVYSMSMRHSYHVKTYALFLAVVNTVTEPFTSIGDLTTSRDLCVTPSLTERRKLTDWFNSSENGNRLKCPTGQLKVDAAAVSAHGSAVLTTAPVLTEEVLFQFVSTAHSLHVLHSSMNLKDVQSQGDTQQRFFQLSSRIFGAKRKGGVRLYVGIGENEFGAMPSSCVSSALRSPPSPRAQLAAAEARRMDTSRYQLENTKGDVARLLASAAGANVIDLAKKLGVTLFFRHQMRYLIHR